MCCDELCQVLRQPVIQQIRRIKISLRNEYNSKEKTIVLQSGHAFSSNCCTTYRTEEYNLDPLCFYHSFFCLAFKVSEEEYVRNRIQLPCVCCFNRHHPIDWQPQPFTSRLGTLSARDNCISLVGLVICDKRCLIFRCYNFWHVWWVVDLKQCRRRWIKTSELMQISL